MAIVHDLRQICNEFQFSGEFVLASPYGDGHINDTYKVESIVNEEVKHYIIQRINHRIFNDVEHLMENISNVTNYLSDLVDDDEDNVDYEVLRLIPTRDGQSYFVDKDGNYWRAYKFVENAIGHSFVKDVRMLYYAAKAFGKFQKMLKDYPAVTLYETIKDFHHTEIRFQTFLKVLQEDVMDRRMTCKDEIRFIMDHESIVSVITGYLATGELPVRVTHNDTKINNVLLDVKTGEGRCVIDLDTVMPGSVLYDFGDAIRSCISTAAEDEEDLEKVHIDLERFEAFTKGFVEAIGDELSELERQLLPFSGVLLTFECGVRFLTDYLQGDLYFKTHRDRHNLIRAKNQFRVVALMEQNMNVLTEIVHKYIRLYTDNTTVNI